jgi:polysaccharide export outer membrane protein
LTSWLLVGCGGGGGTTVGGSQSGTEIIDPEKIQFGETIRVTLTKPDPGAEKEGQEYRVKDDGSISLPLIGSIQVAGRKPKEVETEIVERYVPKYYKHLSANVQYPDRFFYVGGQVRTPNKFPYTGVITVLKAIDSAGGFTDYADKKKVTISRANGSVEIIDCKAALKRPALDKKVYPNDKIEVPMRWM